MRTRSAKPVKPTMVQPDSASPALVPRLPPEVIARIQGWAEAGESPAERLRLRATFELVNKEWYGIVDYLTHILVAKLSDLTKLTTKLRSSKLRSMLGSKTKSVTIEGYFWKAAERKKVYRLLERVCGAESIYFGEWTGAVDLDRTQPSGVAFTDLLATFTNLRYFTIGYARWTPETIKWSVQAFYQPSAAAGRDLRSFAFRLATRWPRLESFALTDTTRSPLGRILSHDTQEVFRSCSHLRELKLESLAGWDVWAGFVASLPATLTTLHLTVYNAFQPNSFTSPAVHQLALVAPNLAEFHFDAVPRHGTEPTSRGLLDRVVGQLASVQRLTVPASAVTDRAISHATLQHLVDLTLRGGYRPRRRDPDPREIVQLIEGNTSLTKLTLCKSLHHDFHAWHDEDADSTWTDHEKGEINRAAEVKSIELVWE